LEFLIPVLIYGVALLVIWVWQTAANRPETAGAAQISSLAEIHYLGGAGNDRGSRLLGIFFWVPV
jgi:hypothetical protein